MSANGRQNKGSMELVSQDELAMTLGQYNNYRNQVPVGPVRPEPVSSLDNIPTNIEPEKNWKDRSSCTQEINHYFFPSNGISERKWERIEREAVAKRICGTCPVIQQCLEYALANREPIGIWGGLNEKERTQIIKLRKQ